MNDLFGRPIVEKPKGEVKGYAKPPGSGPQGETCKTCAHAYCKHFNKRYWKCDLVKSTSGPGTDIRLKSPACSAWQPKPTEEKV